MSEMVQRSPLRNPTPLLDWTHFGPRNAPTADIDLVRRNADEEDVDFLPPPSQVRLNGRLLPETLHVWEDARRDVFVFQRVYGDYWYTTMTVYLRPDDALRRDLLVDLAGEILPAGHVALELYPAASRIMNLRAHYLWSGPLHQADDYRREIIRLKPRLQPRSPGFAVAMGTGDWHLAVTGARSERDWDAVQALKNRHLGAELEAVDVLLPETRGQGVHLMSAPGINRGRIEGGWSDP